MLAAIREDKRLHLPPDHLRHNVLFVTELAAKLRQGFGLVVAAEHAERASEQGRVGR